MRPDRFREHIQEALAACRESLAALEEHYVSTEDGGGDPTDLERIQERVIAYSRFVADLAEYVGQERLGRRLPQRLADKAESFADRIEALGAEAGPDVRLRPGPDEARALAQEARRVTKAA